MNFPREMPNSDVMKADGPWLRTLNKILASLHDGSGTDENVCVREEEITYERAVMFTLLIF